MGEIADMMIEGAMCQTCGEYLGDEVGYPRYCNSCQPDEEQDIQSSKPQKVECPECGKHVSQQGLHQHFAAKHPNK